MRAKPSGRSSVISTGKNATTFPSKALETLEIVLDDGIPNRKLERYQAALIVAFYALHVQRERRQIALDAMLDDDVSGGWDSGTCDDGYGYPVYRVED